MPHPAAAADPAPRHVRTGSGADAACPSTPSVDPKEAAKFEAMAAEWWDPKGNFKPLHRFNPVRLGYIRDVLTARFGRDPEARKPLTGLSLLDIGCGGGLVAEPMARLGADVVAVDAVEANVKAAMAHARASGVTVDYRVGTAEGLLDGGEGPFDAVLNLEVVEHVADPAAFLIDTSALVRPGGAMIVASINRTPKAFALAIVGAEYVLRWLPAGTHDFSKLVRPEEAVAALRRGGLQPQAAQGFSFNPLSGEWRRSRDTAVNYAIPAFRPAEAPAVEGVRPQDVLDYWMGEATRSAAAANAKHELWFGKSDDTDRQNADRFGPVLDAFAETPSLARDWASSGFDGRLAAIIVADQFSRNIHRGTAQAFATDALALELAQEAVEGGADRGRHPAEQLFLYLPFEHAEDGALQARSVALFRQMVAAAPPGLKTFSQEALDYAIRHKEVIDRFGRFPHRNDALGRTSTAAEADYLAEPGAGF